MRVLVIDYDFNIVNSASGQIARVFWNQNNELFHPLVLCAEGDDKNDNKCPVVKVKDQSIIRHCLGLFREMGIPDFCHIPDQRRYSWMPFALRKIRQILKREHFDVIHSISCPESSHLLALQLHKEFGIPWVAQFNDPWIENESKAFRFDRFHIIDKRMERQVAENADLIIHSNRVIVNSWAKRYDNSVMKKIRIFPFSFNIPNLPELPGNYENSLPQGTLNIYHIGHLYGARSAKTFFEGLCKLRNEMPNDFSKIRVNFIGSVSENDKRLVSEYNLSGNVHFLGVMPPDKLNAYYLKADIFLVIDMEVPESPSFPSKLLLSHYYRRPIFCITTKDSIIEDDMKASGHSFCYYGEPDKVASFLKQAVSDYSTLLDFDHEHWKDYTVENVTKLYQKELNELFI